MTTPLVVHPSTLLLACPVCGLDLTVAAASPKEGDRDTQTGEHLHMEVSGNVNCTNGHRFSASGEFLLTRAP